LRAGLLLLPFLATWVNEAFAVEMGMTVGTRLKSKEEIMANMTIEQAARVVMSMQKTKDAPALMALLQKHLGDSIHHAQTGGAALRGKSAASPSAAPSGYAALQPATDMLNSFMAEATMTLDLSKIQCDRFERSQMILLTEAQRDVASFNGLAAESRGCVLRSQGNIAALDNKIPQVREELDDHRRDCSTQVASLKYDLMILNGDITVMEKILNLTKCADTDSSTAAPFFLQTGMEDLLHCDGCGGKDGKIMMQHSGIQKMINALQSKTARAYMHQHLMALHRSGPAVALTQNEAQQRLALVEEGAAHHLHTVRAHRHADDPDSTTAMFIPGTTGDPHLPDVPVPPEPVDCKPTNKCTLGSTSCIALYEKFTVVMGGIVDKRDSTSDELVDTERYCEETDSSLSSQLVALGDQLREQQTNLATCTKTQIDAEAQSHAKGRQHADLKAQYTETLTKCCEDQNNERSEMCALTKIRGELYKLEGVTRFIVDCEVSDWSEFECSATCGGGVRRKSRDILVAPDGGMACPPLTMEEECNMQPCPIDCVLDDWGGWSACSAECGGGVRARSRNVLVEMQHGGEACDETEEEEVCNGQACDADCVLADWSPWSVCNQACGGGNRGRTRSIAAPALGSGDCPAEEEPSRMMFEPCNTFECSTLLPVGRTKLNCASKLDVVIVLDSSGSLGSTGWTMSKELTRKLVESFNADKAADIKVALLVFSSTDKTEWVSHLTTSTTVEDVENDASWFMSTTWTANALALAEGEFLYGRADAGSVAIVITDGKPYSNKATKEAALKLQNKARVMWVPIGPGAPVDLINEMASKPVEDHVIRVADFNNVADDWVANKILAGACPKVS